MSEVEQKVGELFQRAEQLRQAGSIEKIIPIFEEILSLDPDELQPLKYLGMWHIENQDFEAATKRLKRYNELVPNDEQMMLSYAISLEETGDYETALKVLRRCIKLNENNLYPYLYMGSVYQKMGEEQKAAWAYSFAVDLNPSLKTQERSKVLPRPVVARIKTQNVFMEKLGRELHGKAVEKARKKFPKGDFKRIEKALWRKFHGPKVGLVNRQQNPLSFYIPDLARGPWFEREEFPWVEELEGQIGLIKKELLQNFRGDQDTKPYLQLGGYDPQSWGDLVANKNWAAMHFYDGMKKKDEICRKFPLTAKILDELPLFRVKGNPVEALFSVLKAKTDIPPHFGTSNARLTVHLPLVVPDNCYLTVGDEERPFKEGRTMIFDDSFTHKARNESDQVRIVLIFEVWHPDLREEEKEAIENSYEIYEDWMSNRDYDAMLDV